MSGTKRNRATLWKAIQDSQVQDDVDEILAMSDTELDAHLRASGADPEKLRARGEALAKELDARADRPSWRREVDKKLAKFRAAATALRSAPREALSRSQLLDRIALARQDPRLNAPVTTLFRGKTLEASTDEELETLLDQITLLAMLKGEDE